MSDILVRLAAPFPPDRISWRVGPTNQEKTKGIALAYIDARDVMERLDAVMGADWQCDYIPMAGATHCCRIGLWIDGHWRWRANGAVNLSDSDKADAREMAEKGSYSDAFKRAAVLWGIGRYLYDLDSPWVEIKAQGRSYVIADSARPVLLRALESKSAIAAPPMPAIRKNEADPIKKAREWANNAHAGLAKMKSLNELDVWLDSAVNVKKLDYIKKELPEEFAALDDKINVTADRLNTLVAG